MDKVIKNLRGGGVTVQAPIIPNTIAIFTTVTIIVFHRFEEEEAAAPEDADLFNLPDSSWINGGQEDGQEGVEWGKELEVSLSELESLDELFELPEELDESDEEEDDDAESSDDESEESEVELESLLSLSLSSSLSRSLSSSPLSS
ncbi:hypothetical protein TSMEX_003083 [Taenia solium]|eukprot:TsM_000879000 transcript=TsM_000879000 gene=TsM_000879000